MLSGGGSVLRSFAPRRCAASILTRKIAVLPPIKTICTDFSCTYLTSPRVLLVFAVSSFIFAVSNPICATCRSAAHAFIPTRHIKLIAMSALQKVALVTGANRGIGFATARRLGELGFKVLLGARDAKRGEEAVRTLRNDKLDVDLLLMKPTEHASVEAAVQKVEADYKRLDVLINNAALMDFDNKMFPLNIQRMREEFEINFFATVDITNSFLPLMLRSSEAPRLVFVSTPLGTHETVDRPQNKYAHPNLTAYKCTKTAVNMYAHNLAKYLEKYPEEAGGSAASAKVNCCYPGYVQTDMCFNSQEAHFTPYEGAETSVWLATLPADGPTGGFYHRSEKLPW
ncbi:short chain dehydrogenase, putative [Leishmania tarentolae]|uniref:Short chain dehydrogenase, putative n=1 Tax=Leishmania tarentolae TaxID=5689 RepID=A0A640KYJ1_LEITA|nr:short chain dehydrogenase, putative [Leishmania tarentolae]